MGYKEDFKEMVPNLVTYSGIFLLIFLLPGGWSWFLLAVIIPFIIRDLVLIKSFKQLFTFKSLINIIKTLLISSVFYWLLHLLGRYGWLGLLIMVFGFSSYKLFIARGFYMKKVREIELMIWGKTNDRIKKK